MQTNACSPKHTVMLSLMFISLFFLVDAQPCKPSGTTKREKPTPYCDIEGNLCCLEGKIYPTYKCSPSVSNRTKALLTLNSFEKGGDGRGPSKCDKKYYPNDTPVVALSTGWLNNERRCLKNITIYGNGRRVTAMVVDECDSSVGCDSKHDYQPPCLTNIVDASQGVWKALKVPLSDWGELDIMWGDA